jgi:hypothetical protein
VRFRAERLQYLGQGWWAVTSEVKYLGQTVLALLHLLKRRYGAARGRPGPPSHEKNRESGDAEAAVQARGEGRVLPTNIHTECPMEYARRWADAARDYYRIAEGP